MTETEARAALVQTARKYLGYSEASGKHKQIIDIYNAKTPLPRNYKVTYTDAWCATFVSAVAIKCGMANIVPRECSCFYQVEQFQKMERWQENDSYVPKPGDIIYYDWQDSGAGDCTGVPDHVGIVERCSGGLITVIEGNRANSVSERTLVVGARYIRGYGLPDFARWAGQKETTPTPAPVAPAQNNTKEVPKMEMLRKGSKGYQVKVLQLLLILNGCSCGAAGADGDFGVATDAAVRKFQQAKRLEIDGIVGPITWATLLGC